MNRWARALPSALALLALTAAVATAAGPPFPDPVDDQAVYDTAGILSPDTEARLESIIDEVEATVGAELVVYTQVDPFISEDENLASAKALIDEWGIGRSGFDDGLVLMVGMAENLRNGRVSMFAGAGFLGAYANEDALKSIIDSEFVPPALAGNFDAATLDTIAAVAERATPANRDRLEMLRIANSALGLVGAPLALLISLGLAWNTWRREGDDPELTDSPSILMAGPPADMTPPLATVIRRGTGDQHTINTLLTELASTGRISFHNLDQVSSARSDAAADPLTDPAIEVHAEVGDDDDLKAPQREAWDKLKRLAGGSGRLTRERLWRVNSELGVLKRVLEHEAVKLGWLARMPGPSIARMSGIGIGLAVLGAGAIGIGIVVPMSGAVMLGAALILGGIGTFLFGRAMSQRTPNGAYVDAMLTAYRRTLRKTMEQARSMTEVVQEPQIAMLADTPDKAVVWGLALGLHDEVASVLARGLEEQRRVTGSPAGAYYPGWMGATPGSAWSASTAGAAGGVSYGSGSIFSGSAVPDIGGMFNALGRVGATPPSSSSSSGGGGGGFSGGGSSGGGGASGSF
ncbi:MAG TPA: TPM domain-containing protein [Patescibacteria group bacterium]|nr:TPM domain-containing protein [Patescibacteria group bacterium]